VGTELVAHHHAGDHAHAEGHGEDLQPEAVQIVVDLAPGLQPQALEHGQVTGQADADGGEDDVEGDGEGELQAPQLQCIEAEHDGPLRKLIWINIPSSRTSVVVGGLSHWAICRSDRRASSAGYLVAFST